MSSVPVSEEIMQMFNSSVEEEETYNRKLEVCKEVFALLRERIPHCSLLPFGSTMTKMASKGSDLDLVLLLNDSLDYQELMEILETCMTLLRNRRAGCRDAELIPAAVPLVVFTDVSREAAPLRVELSCWGRSGRSSNDGTKNTHLLMTYNQLDPRLRPLVIVVKKWAKHHDLLGPQLKRLSGYALTLMVVFYLQTRQPPVLPCLQREFPLAFASYLTVHDNHEYDFSEQAAIIRNFQSRNSSSLGSLLQGFFSFYANFSYESVISVRTGKCLTWQSCAEHSAGDREWNREVLVEDPIYRHNVTRCTSSREIWRRILNTFQSTAYMFSRRGNLQSIFYDQE